MELNLYSIVDKKTKKRLYSTFSVKDMKVEPRFGDCGVFYRRLETVREKLDLIVRDGEMVKTMDKFGDVTIRWEKGDLIEERLDNYYVELIIANMKKPVQVLTAREVLLGDPKK